MSDPGERESKRLERIDLAAKLVDGDRPAVHWDYKGLGKISLYYLTASDGTRYYQLLQLEVGQDPRNQAIPYNRYHFTTGGSLLAVDRSVLKTDSERELTNFDEASSAIGFQYENGLIAPTPDDDTKVDEILASAVNNPTLTEVFPVG